MGEGSAGGDDRPASDRPVSSCGVTHETAAVSASALVESPETMIVLQESAEAAGGRGAVVRDLREFVDDVMAMLGARMSKHGPTR